MIVHDKTLCSCMHEAFVGLIVLMVVEVYCGCIGEIKKKNRVFRFVVVTFISVQFYTKWAQ